VKLPPFGPKPTNTGNVTGAKFTPTVRPGKPGASGVPVVRSNAASQVGVDPDLAELIVLGLAIPPIQPLDVADERGYHTLDSGTDAFVPSAPSGPSGLYDASGKLESASWVESTSTLEYNIDALTPEAAKAIVELHEKPVLEAIKAITPDKELQRKLEKHYGVNRILSELSFNYMTAEAEGVNPKLSRASLNSWINGIGENDLFAFGGNPPTLGDRIGRLSELAIVLKKHTDPKLRQLAESIEAFATELQAKTRRRQVSGAGDLGGGSIGNFR
jgi:hypothetical protein